MKCILTLVLWVFGPLIGFSQTITDIIDIHTLSTNYQQVEGIWKGPVKISLFMEKELISSNTLPEQMKFWFYNDNGLIKGSPSNYTKDALIELTASSQSSYTAFMPLKGFNYVRGAARHTSSSLSMSIEFQRINEHGIVENSFIDYELRKEYPLDGDFEKIRINLVERLKKEVESAPRSGTGFGLSSDGYVVTNSHVIENAKSIRVRGVDGDFRRSYQARLIKSDNSADLAILKIDDQSFRGLGKVPFAVSR